MSVVAGNSNSNVIAGPVESEGYPARFILIRVDHFRRKEGRKGVKRGWTMDRVRNWVVRVREILLISFFRSAWTEEGERKNDSKFTDPNYPISNSDFITWASY